MTVATLLIYTSENVVGENMKEVNFRTHLKLWKKAKIIKIDIKLKNIVSNVLVILFSVLLCFLLFSFYFFTFFTLYLALFVLGLFYSCFCSLLFLVVEFCSWWARQNIVCKNFDGVINCEFQKFTVLLYFYFLTFCLLPALPRTSKVMISQVGQNTSLDDNIWRVSSHKIRKIMTNYEKLVAKCAVNNK